MDYVVDVVSRARQFEEIAKPFLQKGVNRRVYGRLERELRNFHFVRGYVAGLSVLIFPSQEPHGSIVGLLENEGWRQGVVGAVGDDCDARDAVERIAFSGTVVNEGNAMFIRDHANDIKLRSGVLDFLYGVLSAEAHGRVEERAKAKNSKKYFVYAASRYLGNAESRRKIEREDEVMSSLVGRILTGTKQFFA